LSRLQAAKQILTLKDVWHPGFPVGDVKSSMAVAAEADFLLATRSNLGLHERVEQPEKAKRS
jgi:hypothetical protein